VRVKGIHLPLMVLIQYDHSLHTFIFCSLFEFFFYYLIDFISFFSRARYRGFCLSAITLLPIGSQTLLYGSSDAGKTIHTKDEQLNALMAQLGAKLNLMGREVQGTQVFTPMDIEGHLVCSYER
jgi:hypothetical protein